MTMVPLPFRSVFVTGANGFVGRHLRQALAKRLPIDATVATGDKPDGRPVDLLDAEALRCAVAEARPDLVFHLAAQSSIGQSAGAASATWDVNVCGTLNLAKAIAAAAPRATVAFTSSSEVYGAAFNYGPATEDTALMPLSVYARTKRAAEDALQDTLSETNRLVIFRPSNHSGPGQDTRFVLPSFASQVAAIEAGRQAPIIRVGSLTSERDFLDVRDVVDAYLHVLSMRGGERVDVLNVGSGRSVPIADLLDRVLGQARRPIAVEQDPARTRRSEVPRAEIDTSRLARRTGWLPTRSLDQTIADVMADFRGRDEAGGKLPTRSTTRSPCR